MHISICGTKNKSKSNHVGLSWLASISSLKSIMQQQNCLIDAAIYLVYLRLWVWHTTPFFKDWLASFFSHCFIHHELKILNSNRGWPVETWTKIVTRPCMSSIPTNCNMLSFQHIYTFDTSQKDRSWFLTYSAVSAFKKKMMPIFFMGRLKNYRW